MRLEEFLEKLEDVKQVKNSGEYIAKCPAHDGRVPSMIVKQGRTSKGKDVLLVHCMAGCRTEDIVKVLGLQKSDMYIEPEEGEKDP